MALNISSDLKEVCVAHQERFILKTTALLKSVLSETFKEIQR